MNYLSRKTLYRELFTASKLATVRIKGESFTRDEFLNLAEDYYKVLLDNPKAFNSLYFPNVTFLNALSIRKSINTMTLEEIYEDYLVYLNYKFNFSKLNTGEFNHGIRNELQQ